MKNCSLKEKTLDFVRSSYFPFVVYAVVLSVIHAVMKMGFNDDVFFADILGNGKASFQAFFDFLKGRYETWSSRLVIEGALIIMVHFRTLWKILNVAIMVWIAVAISLYFNKNKKTEISWFIVIGMLCFPMASLHTAGWIATTLNYTWPLAFGFLGFMPIRNEIYGKKTPIWLYVVSFMAFIYAIGQEQMCAVMLAICVFFLIYSIAVKKKLSWYSLVGTVLALGGILFILTCPGNDMRTAAETATWFPEFADLSLFRKVEMGYAFGTFEFMMKSNLAYTLFCFILMFMVYRKSKNPVFRAAATIPFVFSLSMGLVSGIFDTLTPHINSLRYKLTNIGTGFVVSKPGTWLPDLFTFAMAVLLVVSIWVIFKDKKKAFFATYILLLGFATMWIMGLSPTIWASMDRTCAFMYVSVVCVGAMCLSSEGEEKGERGISKTLVAVFSSVFLLMLCDKWLSYFIGFMNMGA